MRLQIALPMLVPATVTVLLFSFVSIWNNYFLPLIMLKDPRLNLVLTSSLLTIIPLIVAFISLQRFWQSGLSLGAVKG